MAIQDHFHFHYPFCNPNMFVGVVVVEDDGLFDVVGLKEQENVDCFELEEMDLNYMKEMDDVKEDDQIIMA